jgi:Aldehyde dehydrogenase family
MYTHTHTQRHTQGHIQNTTTHLSFAHCQVNGGFEPDADVGPVISPEAKARCEALVQSGIDQGAKCLLDGRGVQVPGYPHGNWVGPTLLTGVTPAMDVYKQEVFGPVLSCLEVRRAEGTGLAHAGGRVCVFTYVCDFVRVFQGVHLAWRGIRIFKRYIKRRTCNKVSCPPTHAHRWTRWTRQLHW